MQNRQDKLKSAESSITASSTARLKLSRDILEGCIFPGTVLEDLEAAECSIKALSAARLKLSKDFLKG